MGGIQATERGHLKYSSGTVPRLTRESEWADPSKYGFLDSRFAANRDYLKSSDLDPSLQATQEYQSLVTKNINASATLGLLNSRVSAAFVNPTRGSGPGPRLTNNSNPAPDEIYWPGASTRSWSSQAVPGHYFFYFVSQFDGYATRHEQEIQTPGLGSYVITGDIIVINGYVVFGPSMTESTVYFKWFLPPGISLVPGTLKVTIKSPATCRASTSECVNVKDYYRIANSGSPGLSAEKMTVTRNRMVNPSAPNNSESGDLTVFVDFMLTARINP